jgi:hypothetical protein
MPYTLLGYVFCSGCINAYAVRPLNWINYSDPADEF